MTDPGPLLSVGLPVYNGLPYLERALESLVRQDLADMEIVVCDNASTDGTSETVRRAAARDSRIRYHRNPENIGGARNFNRAFELAKGSYFRWASADDFVSPGALSRCVEVLERDPSAVLAYPETRLVDAEGEVLSAHDEGMGWQAAEPSKRFEYSLDRWGLANIHYGVVRARVLRDTVLIGNYPGSDFVLIADLATRGRFREVKGEYFFRRMHTETTASLDEESLAEFFEPERAEPFEANLLRLYRRHARVVRSAPVNPSEKTRMYLALARRAVWDRSDLLPELTHEVVPTSVLRRLPGFSTHMPHR